MKQRIHMLSMILVLVYSFTAGLMTLLGSKCSAVLRVIAGVTVAASVWLLIQRDVYLPFLGQTFVPRVFLKDDLAPKEADVTTTIDVDAEDGSKVLYWAAQPGSGIAADPKTAYGGFENAGIAMVRGKQATLKFKCPTEYNVPTMTLDRHVHYRVCCDRMGMLGNVQTLWVNCQ